MPADDCITFSLASKLDVEDFPWAMKLLFKNILAYETLEVHFLVREKLKSF